MLTHTATTWKTDVTALVGILQQAFQTLVPSLEAAKIPWREGEAYDDWDAIADVLFEQVVVRSIRWSLPADEGERLQTPRYDMIYPDYSAMSFLSLEVESGTSQILVFHSFGTTNRPFDTARLVALGEGGRPMTDRLERMAVEGARFRFLHRQFGELASLDRLSVQL